jgi:hypothetical protein
MDQGLAAVCAAGIGVGGVVITAGMGWYAARKAAASQIEAAHRAASAQVEAALAGVREQFIAQRQEAMWQVRREAYTAFLGQVEAVRVEIVELAHLCGEAIDVMERSRGAAPNLDTPRDQLAETFRNLWLRDSALRLSVDAEEAEQAEQLRLLVMAAVEDVSQLVDVIHTSGQFRARAAWRRSQTSIDALHEGIMEWTRNARSYLGATSQET